jgi:Zn-finger nucleic acid-binding protein
MQKTCPKCAGELLPIARGAFRCAACAGMLLPPSLVPAADEPSDAAPAGEHDAQGGRCPNDGTILSRTQIDIEGRTPIHLERCSSCRSIWFDRGEWALLADQQLLDHIDELWTAEWRAQQRRARSDREYQQRLREEFGPELYDALQAVALKLKGYERRSQALAFLREASSK